MQAIEFKIIGPEPIIAIPYSKVKRSIKKNDKRNLLTMGKL